MQHVKKMVLIPHDEYNSWIQAKKSEGHLLEQDIFPIPAKSQTEHPVPETERNLDPNFTHNIPIPPADISTATPADVSTAKRTDAEKESLSGSVQKELLSKVGKTVIDVLVSRGARGLQDFIGIGDSSTKRHISETISPPPPGEPEAKKKKRNLTTPPDKASVKKTKLHDLEGASSQKTSTSSQKTSPTSTGLTWKSLP